MILLIFLKPLSTVPLSAIILLSVLGGCLIIVGIIYKFVNFETCCAGGTKDKEKDKIDKSHYVELGQSDSPPPHERNRSNSQPRPNSASQAFDDTDYIARAQGRPKAKSVTSLSRGQIIKQPRRPSAIPTSRAKTPPSPSPRRDTLSLATLESMRTRVRSESDLSLGASASQYTDQYSSWGDSLTKMGPPRKPASPMKGQGRRAGGRAMSAYGDIISLRPPNVSTNVFGRLQVSVAYAPTAQRLEIEVIRVEQLHQIMFQMSLGAEIAVHIALIPSKRARFKTKSKQIHNPSFQERWVVKNVSRQELDEMKMRFRIYSSEFLGKGRLFGEATEVATSFELEDIGATTWLNIVPTMEIKALMESK